MIAGYLEFSAIGQDVRAPAVGGLNHQEAVVSQRQRRVERIAAVVQDGDDGVGTALGNPMR